MIQPRPSPLLHVSWLKKLLVGDNSCEWATWFRAHYVGYKKEPFNLTTWKVEHTALVNRKRKDLESEGQPVRIEAQNKFTLSGRVATLIGQPDLITASDGKGIIIDIKTGYPCDADIAQVMIYMWAIPLALPFYKSIQFDGLVVYHDQEIPIPHSEIKGSFPSRLVELIQRVAAESPAIKVPSSAECRFCDLTKDSCPDRIEYIGNGTSDPTTLF